VIRSAFCSCPWRCFLRATSQQYSSRQPPHGPSPDVNQSYKRAVNHTQSSNSASTRSSSVPASQQLALIITAIAISSAPSYEQYTISYACRICCQDIDIGHRVCTYFGLMCCVRACVAGRRHDFAERFLFFDTTSCVAWQM
jgi:hypothetical protein